MPVAQRDYVHTARTRRRTRRRRECTSAGGTPLCQLLKYLLNNLRYQIRLHLFSKPHYYFQFRQFALENHIFYHDVANACSSRLKVANRTRSNNQQLLRLFSIVFRVYMSEIC